ncbi:transposase [Parasphingorhabdus pacifica]
MVAKRRGRLKRCINRFEQWRGIATRYERTAAIYLAALHIAGIFLWSAR